MTRVLALLAAGIAAGWLSRRLVDRLRPTGCPGCQHTSEYPHCACPRQDCVCRAARRARFDAAVATLSPRDQQWLTANRARISAALETAGLDDLDPRSLDRQRLDEVIATTDMAEIRRIFHHQIAEADDPAAMHRFIRMLLTHNDSDPSTPT